MKEKINVGFCISYDWELLQYAIPLIYDEADQICLSVDKDRISWNHLPFEFNESEFNQFVRSIDKDHKIRLFEADFHQENLIPKENEVRQRTLMADFMGQEGWHIQLDCDEYFLNFKGFVDFLRRRPVNQDRVNICCALLIIFKKVDEGFLVIAPETFAEIEFCPIATRFPNYEYGRKNGYFNILTDFAILHQSWARDPAEIRQKLSNWGHVGDYNPEEFFALWENLSGENYTQLRNFHPIQAEVWSKLELIQSEGVDELIKASKEIKLPIRPFLLWEKNSKNISRVKKLGRMLFGFSS